MTARETINDTIIETNSDYEDCSHTGPLILWDRQLRYIAAGGVTLFSLAGVIVNSVFLYAITRTKYVPRITRHFLACIALGDLIRLDSANTE